jgi:O-antigen/teichoic acid export membrane protein
VPDDTRSLADADSPRAGGESPVAGVSATMPHGDPALAGIGGDMRGLDRQLITGIAWTGGMKWAVQGITWASTIIVARLLTPADYGLVGMAALLMGLLTLMAEAGIGLAIVTMRDLNRSQIAQINTVAVQMGLAGMLIAAAAAYPLSRFFGAPALIPVVMVMSIGFVITAFRVVPYALMQRDMRFRVLALIEGGTALLMAVVMVLLAWLGFRYWTLVIGGLINVAVSAGLAVALQPHGFGWPRLREIGPALRFSWHTLVSRLSWYTYSQADFVVAGRVLGQSALGAYNFAWTLASIPVEKVVGLFSRVLPAVFAAVQDDPPALRRYFLNITEAIALVTFPMTIGLALVSPLFVPLVLGEQWLMMVAPLQLIALYASVRAVSPLLVQVLIAVRETRFNMWNSVLAAIVLPIAFIIGSRWGTVGIALAWIIVHPLILLPLFFRVRRAIDVSWVSYGRALWPAVGASVIMAIAVLAIDRLVPAGVEGLSRLIMQIGAGAVGYVGTLLLLHRRRVKMLVDVVKSLRRKEVQA